MNIVWLGVCTVVAVVAAVVRYLDKGPRRPTWDLQMSITVAALVSILRATEKDTRAEVGMSREKVRQGAEKKRAFLAGISTKSAAALDKEATAHYAQCTGNAASHVNKNKHTVKFTVDKQVAIERLDREILAACGGALEPFITAVNNSPTAPPLTAEWARTSNCTATGDQSQRVVLFLHGGAFVSMSAEAMRGMVANICVELRVPVLSVNYRLAPEFPFPCALLDAVSAYVHLVRTGHDQIVVMGDSAGGGLVLSLLVFLRDMQQRLQQSACIGRPVPLPNSAVLFSPWCDLSLSLPSAVEVENTCDYLNLTNSDPALIGDGFLYAAGLNALDAYTDPLELNRLRHFTLTNPYLSPVRAADLSHGLPPILVQAGACEVLLSDQLALFYAAQPDKTLFPLGDMVAWVRRMTAVLASAAPPLTQAGFTKKERQSREWQWQEQGSGGTVTVQIYRDMVHDLPALSSLKEFHYSLCSMHEWLDGKVTTGCGLHFIDVHASL